MHGVDNDQILEDLLEVVKKTIDLCRNGHMVLERRLVEKFPMSLENTLERAIEAAGTDRRVLVQMRLQGDKLIIMWIPMMTAKEQEAVHLERSTRWW